MRSWELSGGGESRYEPSIRIRYITLLLAIIMSLRIGEVKVLVKDAIAGLARSIG